MSTRGDERLLAVYEMIRVLNSQTDPEKLLESLLDMALEVVRAERGLILLAEGDGDYRVRLARNLEKQTIADAVAFSRSVVGDAGRGESVLAIDTDADERLRELRSVSLFGIRSILCVPLRAQDRIVGAVYLDSRTEGALFDNDDLRFLEAFADQAALALANANRHRQLQERNSRLRRVAERRARFGAIVGGSAAMQELYAAVQRVAQTDLPVLIHGESGTGKELVAREIQRRGPLAERPFLSQNCGVITETLLESELFGHVKGAFTGAERDRAGLFEQADGGTLFLDEVGDMPSSMQARLLRVLQEGELRRVGGNETIPVQVRVITATHRDLEEEVDAGRFREDLFYRLQVLAIEVPPLRDRPGDVEALTRYFLAQFAAAEGASPAQLDPDLLQRFERCSWPGNVRQLENVIRGLLVEVDGGRIEAALVDRDPRLRKLLGTGTPGALSLDANEREQIRRALESTGGNKAGAARLLGISRATIFRKIKEHGL